MDCGQFPRASGDSGLSLTGDNGHVLCSCPVFMSLVGTQRIEGDWTSVTGSFSSLRSGESALSYSLSFLEMYDYF